MTDHQREKFETAVVQRLKGSGFFEIEIRTEALVRCGDGYQDEVVNAGWHYWNAALLAASKAAAPVIVDLSDEELDQLQKAALSGPGDVAIIPVLRSLESNSAFSIGDLVRKKSGSWWEGRVVGFYTTEQTPDGVCVQLDKPMGPVQIYPASALELVEKLSPELRENPQWTSEELQQFATQEAEPLAIPRLHVKPGDCRASVLLGGQQLIATAETSSPSASSDYSELEALAKAATPGPHHIYTFARDDNNWKANEAFVAAVWPQVVLDLISKVRQTPPPSTHVTPAADSDSLHLAVAAVLKADAEFRSNMPKDWGGDPLSDELDGLRRIFEAMPAPAQHVEWGDWTVDDTDTARQILNYLGIGDDASREPGADRRRDKIAGMIRARLDAAPAPQQHVAVTEAAKRYLEAIDSDPENDIWDTWDGKPAEGALKTASDASWADHGQKIEARLSELRAALASMEGSDNG